MKIYCIKAKAEDYPEILSHYDEKGILKSSYLFRGTGKCNNIAFYMTHGQPKGYFVMDCNGLRKADYSQTEFAFYINGLLENNHRFDGIDRIITIECFGGYHKPSVLSFGKKKLHMESLSKEKEVLWVGWRKIDQSPFLFAVAFTPDEYNKFNSESEVSQSVEIIINNSCSKIKEEQDFVILEG